jgi:hypothetical protein
MALLIKRLLLASAVFAGAAGCFSPPEPPCAFSCAEDGLCPSGYSCQADGICHRDGDQRSCDIPPQADASATDADDASAADTSADAADAQ